MTTIEKRKKIIQAIDSLTNEQLDEAWTFIEQIKENDEKRLEYIKTLIEKEKNLFDRLAK